MGETKSSTEQALLRVQEAIFLDSMLNDKKMLKFHQEKYRALLKKRENEKKRGSKNSGNGESEHHCRLVWQREERQGGYFENAGYCQECGALYIER